MLRVRGKRLGCQQLGAQERHINCKTLGGVWGWVASCVPLKLQLHVGGRARGGLQVQQTQGRAMCSQDL